MILFFVAVLLATLTGCGYAGDPAPPATNFPAPVLDLSVRQTGDQLRAAFTMPNQTVEGLPVRPGEIELRVGPSPEGGFSTERWLAVTRGVRIEWPQNPHVDYAIDAREWAGKSLIAGVRIANPKGRFGSFSNFVALRVAEPLTRPDKLRFTEVAAGVRLEWTVPARTGVRHRVYKRETGQKEPEPILAATVEKAEFLDESITYGKVYQYWVESFLADNITSERSDEASITPKDTFPPAAPAGLTALLGSQSVELAWDRSTEFDFQLYRVYRKVDGEAEWKKLAETGATPSLSDKQAPAGKRVSYAVTAVDERGNESARSEPVSVDVN